MNLAEWEALPRLALPEDKTKKGCRVSQAWVCAIAFSGEWLSVNDSAALALLAIYRDGTEEQKEHVRKALRDFRSQGERLSHPVRDLECQLFEGDPPPSKGRKKADGWQRDRDRTNEVYQRRKAAGLFTLPTTLEELVQAGPFVALEAVIKQDGKGLEKWICARTSEGKNDPPQFPPNHPESLEFLGLSGERLLRLYRRHRKALILADLVRTLLSA